MRRRLVLLGSLYFAQGLPFGFFTQTVPLLLRKHGWSPSEVGLTGLLAVPWALKFAWALAAGCCLMSLAMVGVVFGATKELRPCRA